MAAPYSTDLHARAAFTALQGELTRAEVAWQFDIGEATLSTGCSAERRTPRWSLCPTQAGRRRAWMKRGCSSLADLVEQANDCTIEEYRVLLEKHLGASTSGSARHRAPQKLKLPRKKTLRTAEQN
jgi:transposase